MKKNMKKLYVYALIMVFCVIIIVLVTWMSESQKSFQNEQSEFENKLTARQTEIQKLEKKNAELQDKVYELEKSKTENNEVQSKLDKYVQTMNDLTEVYKLAEAQKKSEAREKLSAIDPSGFDDAERAFYELLKKNLEN